MTRRTGWAGWISGAVAALLFAGCGGSGSSSDGTAQLRLLNASPGYAGLDLYVGDTVQNSAISYGKAGAYASVGVSSISTVITTTGSSAALSTATRSLTKDASQTLVAYGWAGALKTALITENSAAAATGKASLMVENLAPDVGTLDVYLTGTDDLLADATPLATAVASGGSYGFSTVNSGTYRLRVTGTGDKSDLRLDVGGLTLASTQVATLVLTPGSGGVLVNGLLVAQAGPVTPLTNTQARVKAVASVASHGAVTLGVGGTALLANAVSPYISSSSTSANGSYTLVNGGSAVATTLVVNGSTVAVPAQALAAGGDYTLLVWGDATAPQLALVTDDNRLPTVVTNAELRLINGVNALAAPLTLTADFSAMASNVAAGQASAYATLPASTTTRLDVTSALSNTPLYTLTNTPIAAKGLYTVYLLGDGASPSATLLKTR